MNLFFGLYEKDLKARDEEVISLKPKGIQTTNVF
jgi:hypothetical protein